MSTYGKFHIQFLSLDQIEFLFQKFEIYHLALNPLRTYSLRGKPGCSQIVLEAIDETINNQFAHAN